MAMDMQRSKVLLLIPHLGGGGAERVMELLACGLDVERFEVHLGVVCRPDRATHTLPVHVFVHFLGARRVRTGWWRVLRLIWNLRPRLILSGMAHLNFLVLLMKTFYPRGVKVLVRQNGALPTGRFGFTVMAYRLLYPQASGIVAQSAAMAAEISHTLGIHRSQVRALKNPILFPVERPPVKTEDRIVLLLAVGRLVHEKGFDLLLRAFANRVRKHPELRLKIAGEGSERVRLEQLILSLGLHNYAELAGHQVEPVRASNADVFVLSSRSEGMPNALLEAASYGLPIVATPCSSSVTDLLAGKPGVWMAEDVSVVGLEAALASALREVGQGERYEHEFIAPFEYRLAVSAYEEYFHELLAR